jgi:pSer/pThr/pTyr-binding forkhead associated (FHA) protein
MRPSLIAIMGNLKGRKICLDGPPVSIGRDDSNNIRLRDANISRHHCLIKEERDQYAIIDLNSKYGTFVNGARVRESSLTEGSLIQIGNHTFRFCLHRFHAFITRLKRILSLST